MVLHPTVFQHGPRTPPGLQPAASPSDSMLCLRPFFRAESMANLNVKMSYSRAPTIILYVCILCMHTAVGPRVDPRFRLPWGSWSKPLKNPPCLRLPGIVEYPSFFNLGHYSSTFLRSPQLRVCMRPNLIVPDRWGYCGHNEPLFNIKGLLLFLIIVTYIP